MPRGADNNDLNGKLDNYIDVLDDVLRQLRPSIYDLNLVGLYNDLRALRTDIYEHRHGDLCAL